MQSLVLWIGRPLVRRRFGRKLDLPPAAARLRLVSRIGAAVVVATLLGWVGLVSALTGGEGELSPMLAALYVAGVVSLVGAVAIVVEAALRTVRGPGGWLVKLGEIAFGLSGLFIIWAVFQYGLANFNFNF